MRHPCTASGICAIRGCRVLSWGEGGIALPPTPHRLERRKFSMHVGHVYQLLDDLPSTASLVARPQSLWIIISLEVVLEYKGGRYLLVEQPYYPYEDDDSCYDAGYWYTPFTAVKVELGMFAPRQAGEVEVSLSQALAAIDAKKEVTRLAYNRGIIGSTIVHSGSLTELKSSTRSMGETKAYRIERYACGLHPEVGLANVADPEALKGNVFLPLDRLEQVLLPTDRVLPGKPMALFRGHPLSTNLHHLVTNTPTLSR